PYLTQLETRVASVAGAEVALEATIFYALSGGQESDASTIGGKPVLEARKSGVDILYRLQEDHGLVAGEAVTVTVAIDWERRYRLMRLHFAAEVVLELAYKHLAGIEKIGAHIAADKARIDFEWAEPITPSLPLLGEGLRRIVESNRPIVSAFNDEAAQRRYWEVPGFARVPCGGTHLKRTGEVGTMTLKRRNIGKGKERVEIFLAGEAR
ncbi:alanyl-tRNA editing protein, partial [Hypericibacter sp.]|uniref:alanyl-tRNA editing protein n=1 Tax=Hypericibacter sp. TaxID=2705401 RepID=UPI003D6C8977